jgi:hypothetical protein
MIKLTRYELEYPIEYASQSITALDLARPTVGVMKSFDLNKWDVSMTAKLVSKLASVPNSDLPVNEKMVDQLDFSDIAKIGELIVSWFPKSNGN